MNELETPEDEDDAQLTEPFATALDIAFPGHEFSADEADKEAAFREDVIELHNRIQSQIVDSWDVYANNEEGLDMLTETDDMVLFIDPEGDWIEVELSQVSLDLDHPEFVRDTLTRMYRKVAERNADYDWSVAYPIPVGKTREQRIVAREVEYRAAGLPAKQAEARALNDHGLSESEVAREMGVSEGAASSHLHRVREKIEAAHRLVALADEGRVDADVDVNGGASA